MNKRKLGSFREAFIWHMKETGARVLQKIKLYVSPFAKKHQEYINKHKHRNGLPNSVESGTIFEKKTWEE